MTADAPDPPRPPFALGILAERYELLGVLGQGGMAVVYHARELPVAPSAADGAAGREVAIKVVSSRYAGDDDALRRFAREARTVAGLDHPNVVRTLAIEEMGGTAVAIVTEYVRGRTLRAALGDAGGPLPFDVTAATLRDVAAALAYAHARRIVHRDVKPENIFLSADGGHALLADFGIARALDADPGLTVDGAALGTPTYMAPEQIAGRPVDERTDVYALALVAWEMLAGRRPWQGETLYAVLHNQQFETLPDLAALRPDIPAYLLEAVRGGLAKNPAARWRDGAEFLERLTPRAQPLPALTPAGGEAVTGETMRVVTPHEPVPPVAPAPRAVEAGAARTTPARDDVEVVWEAPAGARPPAAPPARDTPARPTRRPRRARAAVLGAGLALAAAAGTLAVRARAAERARAADAATTGVSDAQLDTLLRAANAAATAAGPVPAAGAAVDASPNATPAPNARLQPPAAPPAAPLAEPSPAPAAPRRAAPVRLAAPRRVAARAVPPDTAPAAAGSGDAPGSALGAAPRAASEVAVRAAGDPRCRSAANADQQACLLAAVARQDAGLNASYQALIAELRARAGGAAEPPSVRALRVEQRAWVDARDRQCRAAVAGREDDRWGAARAPCFAALSAERASEFDARRERLDAGQPN